MADKAYVGNIKIAVAIPDMQIRGREELRRFRAAMRVAHDEGIREGRQILSNILSSSKYYDTGTLFESVASRLFVRTEDIFQGSIHFNNPGKEYAYFVEHGRGPGLPPPAEKMKAWGARKGLSYEHTMAIRAKIAAKGTKPKPFMNRAEREIQENYNLIVSRALQLFNKGRT